MRIIAGMYKGRRVAAPRDRRVRRTLERVREAWFSILATRIRDARVVDLFAGSGVLGLEALSRGATSADFVDIAAGSLATIQANIAALAVQDRTTVHRSDALRFAERLSEGAYDVAFADPPFGTGQAEQLAAVFRAGRFADVLSIEHSPATVIDGDETRRYGDVVLTFLYGS